MKCQYCNGTGEHINDANRMTTCEFCGGTGIIKPLTNDEWRRSCTSEEFAKVISDLINENYWCTEEEVLAWLKEIHNG